MFSFNGFIVFHSYLWWLTLCVNLCGLWVTSYLVKHDSGCFSEGGFGWDLYLNWYTLRKQIAFYNVGGPRAISWRSEKNKKLTSLEQERICQQTALELELQHQLLPGSLAWPPLDLSCNFPVAANFSALPAFFIKFWAHQTSQSYEPIP